LILIEPTEMLWPPSGPARAPPDRSETELTHQEPHPRNPLSRLAEPINALRGGSAAALIVRRVLPLVILVPIVIGSLRMAGERQGWYDSAIGTSLRSLVEVVLGTVLLWWAAAAVRTHERAQRRSEADLRRQSTQLAAFLDTAAICLHRVGPDGIVLWANDAELKALGYSRQEYIGRHIAEFHADQGVIEDILARLHRGQRLTDFKARMKCKDGSIKTVLLDASVLWEDGRFIHTQCFARDITAQLRSESLLRESERRSREIIDALPAAIYTTDATGRLTSFNPAAVEFSGRVPELGTDQWCVSWKLFHPDGTPMPHDRCPMAIAIKEGRAVRGAEAIAERPDGKRLWFEPFPTPLRDADGVVVGGINMLVDITERKRAEAAGSTLAAIVESSDDAIISKDLSGVITSWNRGAERIFGYTAAEAVGQSIYLIIPAERRSEEVEVLTRLRRGEKVDHFETERQTKDGRRVNISLTVSPVRDGAGRVIGASKVARDITERKAAETALAAHQQQLEQRVRERTAALAAMHERLRLTDRMAAVGTLAAGLAHDMKNVLMPLGVRLDAILTSPGLSRTASTELGVVCALLDHLRAMAGNLSLFARDPNQEGSEGRTDLARWCGQVRGFIDASAGTAVVIKWEVPEGLPTVGIAPHRMTQAVLNLVHNARDAILATQGPLAGTPGSGQITVTATHEPQPGADAPRVFVTVRDNGCGMTAEVRRQCREPFFTTKDRPASAGASGGTGLGLSLAYAIVERVGGSLDIESEPGVGTAVILSLPAAAPEHAPSPAAGRARVSIQNQRIRSLVGHVLGALRYEVLDEAVASSSSGPAVLTDGSLWVTDGHGLTPDAAATFIRQGPGRRVIALWDDGDHGDAATGAGVWRAAGVEICPRSAPIARLRAVLAGEPPARGEQT
jgi:PAS domain S-box-containing protein